MPEILRLDKVPNKLFAIGDIHGCPAEVEKMLCYLEDVKGLSQEDLVVFMGDYIDRGPDSKGVIDLLLSFQSCYPQTIFLKGNHEDMFLDYLGLEGNYGSNYMMNGGVQCLRSYEISSIDPPDVVAKKLPEGHLNFLKNLTSGVQVGDFILVHAGINPIKKLEDQTPQDLYWIRDEFIMNVHRLDKTVLFGHTPFEDLMLHLPYKIGLDTGLYYGNMLTCVAPMTQEVYQIKRKSSKIVAKRFKDFA